MIPVTTNPIHRPRKVEILSPLVTGWHQAMRLMKNAEGRRFWRKAMCFGWLAALSSHFLLPLVWLDRSTQSIEAVSLFGLLKYDPGALLPALIIAAFFSAGCLFLFSRLAAHGMLGFIRVAEGDPRSGMEIWRDVGEPAPRLGRWIAGCWLLVLLASGLLVLGTIPALKMVMAAPSEVAGRLALAILLLAFLTLFVLLLSAGYFFLLLTDFVLPFAVWFRLGMRDAWATAWPQIKPWVGKVYIYVMVKLLLLSVITSLAGWVVLLFPSLVWLPAFEVAVLLPLFLVLRCYSLAFTRQFLVVSPVQTLAG